VELEDGAVNALKGKKTFAMLAIGGLVMGLHAVGVIDNETKTTLLEAAGLGAGVTFKMGQNRLEAELNKANKLL
jgi:hypothetical protein